MRFHTVNHLTSSIGRHRSRTPTTALVWLGLITFVTSFGSLTISQHTDRVSAIWLANAVALPFLLTTPRKDWWRFLLAFAAGAIAGDLAYGDDLLNALVLPLFNVTEILIVAVPLRQWRMDREFTKPKSLLVFYALAVGPATITSALMYGAYMRQPDFFASAINWYAADALGLAILVPPLMTVKRSDFVAMFAPEKLAGTLLLIGVIVATAALNYLWRDYPFAFMFFPAIVLLTFQRGFAGGAIGLLITALYMIVPVILSDPSPGLRHHTIREQMTIVQIFVAVSGLSVVLVGAALEEARRLTRRLGQAIAVAENAREEAIVARDAAMQASRTKSMFLANMSHELRTPLNAVIGFAELMRSELFGPLGDAHYNDYSGKIHDAGHHLLDLINDILDMSKIEAGKLELEHRTFGIDGTIRDTLDLMQDMAMQADVELAADLPPGSLTIHADQRAMRQILLNLLSNAVKFTPPGGRVVVRARVIDGELILSVKDTGVGIPANRLGDLGNPFVQIRNTAGETQQGTGLGLALVRSLTELHGGTMRIESAAGQGTAVTIRIPAHEAKRAAAA